MRLGIFGGSFDPVHYGHLLLAELCREHAELNEVRLVPAATPPHKQDQGRAAGEDRLQMLDLALGAHPQLRSWDFELNRGGVSYTVDTLEALHKERPDDELCFLMGADSLFDLPNWRAPERICELATIVVVDRPGSRPVSFEPLADVASEERIAIFQASITPMPQIDISSSEIRMRVAKGMSIRFQTPRAVEAYIREKSLYV